MVLTQEVLSCNIQVRDVSKCSKLRIVGQLINSVTLISHPLIINHLALEV